MLASSWSCSACTLQNADAWPQCAACESPRPGDLLGARLPAACCWDDAAFPSSLAGAPVSLSFSGGRTVRVPLLWRRPADVVDEAGGLDVARAGAGGGACARCRPAPALDLVADLMAAAVAARSAGGGTDAAYLAEQAARGGGARPARVGGPPWALWRAGMSAADVVQGALGDCWLVSALALVAERPWLVRRLFVDAGGEADAPLLAGGRYRVRLCLRGVWQVIAVDDTLPCSAWSGRLAYASCRRRQLWAPLVEKALAKAAGGYARLTAGSTAEGLRMLTGAPVLSVTVATGLTNEERLQAGISGDATTVLPPGEAPPPHIAEALWTRLASYADAGYLLGASAWSAADDDGSGAASGETWRARARAHDVSLAAMGIVSEHAYSVLDLHHVEMPGGGSLRLVRLRNPWAGPGAVGGGGAPQQLRTWRGAWCDASPAWAAVPALVERLGPYRQADEGVFFMAFSDFVVFFSHVVVCKVRGMLGGEHDPSREWPEARLCLPLPLPGDAAVTVARVALPHSLAMPLDVVVTFGGWAEPGDDVGPEGAAGGAALYAGSGGLLAPSCGAMGALVVRECGPDGPAGGNGGAAAPALAAAVSGLALVRGSPAVRTTSGTLSAECEVDRGGGELLIVAHALASALDGRTDRRPWVTIEVHAPRPLLLERVQRPLPWLGRALSCMALTHGKQLVWSGGAGAVGATVVTYSDNGGVLVCAANLGDCSVEVTTAIATAPGALTWRAGHTRDVLRPRSAQLLQVLSARARAPSASGTTLGSTTISARTLAGSSPAPPHAPALRPGDLCAPFTAAACVGLPAFLLP